MTAIIKTIIFTSSLILTGCAPAETTVEITDTEERAKYIELLEQKNIPYTIDDEGILTVNMRMTQLEEQMIDYREWREQKLKEEGVVIPE